MSTKIPPKMTLVELYSSLSTIMRDFEDDNDATYAVQRIGEVTKLANVQVQGVRLITPTVKELREHANQANIEAYESSYESSN